MYYVEPGSKYCHDGQNSVENVSECYGSKTACPQIYYEYKEENKCSPIY